MKHVTACLVVVVALSAEPIRIQRYLPAPMRDGVKLYGDLYRPVREGKFPVLVVRTPYGVQRDGMHESFIRFAQHGYAVYAQDVRGRYESEGQWEPFRHEAEDGHDTVVWASKQPWSNGKVALQGGSYLGHVQWRARLDCASRSGCHVSGFSFYRHL